MSGRFNLIELRYGEISFHHAGGVPFLLSQGPVIWEALQLIVHLRQLPIFSLLIQSMPVLESTPRLSHQT